MRFLVTAVLCIALMVSGCDTQEYHSLLRAQPATGSLEMLSSSSWQMQVMIYHVVPDGVTAQYTYSQLEDVVWETQELYANEMEQHGFPRKTFQVRPHADGSLVKLLRLPATEYTHASGGYIRGAVEDMAEKLSLVFYGFSLNVFFFEDSMPSYCGLGGELDIRRSWQSNALIFMRSGCNLLFTTAHEIGHGFGWGHVQTPGLMSPAQPTLSFSHDEASWLNHHQAFNPEWGGLPFVSYKPQYPLIQEDVDIDKSVIHVQIPEDYTQNAQWAVGMRTVGRHSVDFSEAVTHMETTHIRVNFDYTFHTHPEILSIKLIDTAGTMLYYSNFTVWNW